MTRKKHVAALLLALLLLTVPAAAAGIYHAPVLTVVAPFAPNSLKVTVTIEKGDKTGERHIPVVLEAQRKGWEMQYMLRREAVYGVTAWFGNAYDLKDASLTLEQDGQSRSYTIPAELLSERGSEDYIRLNWRTGEMSRLSAGRTPLLLVMWVAIALAAEGVVFWLFGYRNRRSWIVFFIINLITQGAHHMLVSGINVDVNRIKVYILFIPVLFLVEMIAFVMFVDERSRDRTISFAVAGNVASQAAVGLLMPFLPA
ncbi:MAG: hypothetical protein E7425_04960 [Ruminococcaceae bacterium]|jgi:hypothetical protein|nr:hypothetical protein [Oscillospiraceae bacterium]